MSEQKNNWFAVIINLGAPIFSVLGGIAFCLLIQCPDRINYAQQVVYDRIAIFTLTSLIAGLICGIISLCFSHRNSSYLTKSVVWLCLIFLAVTFFSPRLFVKSVLTAKNICINNARKIEAVKAEWASATGATNDAEVNWNEIASYFTNGIPKCPEGGMYDLGKIGTPVLCSIPSHRLPPQPQ